MQRQRHRSGPISSLRRCQIRSWGTEEAIDHTVLEPVPFPFSHSSIHYLSIYLSLYLSMNSTSSYDLQWRAGSTSAFGRDTWKKMRSLQRVNGFDIPSVIGLYEAFENQFFSSPHRTITLISFLPSLTKHYHFVVPTIGDHVMRISL